MSEDIVLPELNRRWHCDLPFGWVPITGAARFSDELAVYEADAFAEQFDHALPTLLARAFGISTWYAITEGGAVETVALADCLFRYDGLERMYTDEAFQFLLYFSHESSVTAAGKALVELIHQHWPAFNEHSWAGY